MPERCRGERLVPVHDKTNRLTGGSGLQAVRRLQNTMLKAGKQSVLAGGRLMTVPLRQRANAHNASRVQGPQSGLQFPWARNQRKQARIEFLPSDLASQEPRHPHATSAQARRGSPVVASQHHEHLLAAGSLVEQHGAAIQAPWARRWGRKGVFASQLGCLPLGFQHRVARHGLACAARNRISAGLAGRLKDFLTEVKFWLSHRKARGICGLAAARGPGVLPLKLTQIEFPGRKGRFTPAAGERLVTLVGSVTQDLAPCLPESLYVGESFMKSCQATPPARQRISKLASAPRAVAAAGAPTSKPTSVARIPEESPKRARQTPR
jgi:hypothetical protein